MKGDEKRTRACPACGEEILITARKCKHCQEWLDGEHAQSVAITGPPVVTEQISKYWKAWQLSGSVVLVVSASLLGIGLGVSNPRIMIIAVVLAVPGFGLFVATRLAPGRIMTEICM